MRKGKASTPSRDASKRKRMSEELRESEERYRTLMENAPVGICNVDLEGTFTFVNKRFEKVSGYLRSEVVGKNAFTLSMFDDETLKVLAERIKSKLRGEATRRIDARFRCGDGKWIWVELEARVIKKNATPVGFQLISRDITERKKMEQQIRTFTQFLGAAVNNSPDLIFIKDRDLRYVVVSDAACDFAGRPREEIVGRTAQDLYPRDFADSVERTDREVLEKGAVVDVPESRSVRGEETRIYHTRKAPLRDASGNIAHIISIARDATERMRIEEALRQSEAKLKALHRHARTLAVANSIEEVAKHTLDAMEFTLGFDIADFCLVEKGYVHVNGSRGIHVSPFLIASPLDGPGAVVKGVNEKRTLRIPDTRKEPVFVDRRSFPASEDLQPMLSELVVPVLTDSEVVSVLNVESSRLNAFTDEDQELLETLAMHVASALRRLRQVGSLERTVELRASELKASEEKYRRLVDNMTDVVFTIDLKGNFTFCSPAAEMMTGYSVQQLLSMNMKELIAPEHFPEIQERLQARIQGERYLPPHRFEIIKADGKWIPVEMTTTPTVEKGTLTGIQGIARDISERRKTESDLKESEERFRGITERSIDLIYEVNLEGRLTYVSPAAESILGYKADEMVGTQFRNYLAPSEFPRVTPGLESLMKGKDIRSTDVHMLRKDGIEIIADVNVAPIFKNGRLVGAQGILRDITGRKQMEKKLREAERLATIGETTAMVGHDLRNPLTGITGAVYILKTISNMKKDSKAKEFLDLIERNVQYSNKIISDLLDYSAELHLNLTATNPKSIITDSLRFVPIPENIQVADLSRSDTQLIADAEKLRRVAVNLITNAVDAMPEGGTLTISSRQSNNDVEIAFSDTGIGMTKETMEKLGTPLLTTKAKGMGFGMAIVKRIVEAHGGSVFVETSAGRGSTFRVKLPIEPELKEVNKT